mgnify:CR=1 FL=1
MLTVAPREVADLVYRAARVTGVASGAARQIARAALFSEIQLTGALEPVVDRLVGGHAPALGVVPLARLEAIGHEAGPEIGLAEPVTVADLAEPAWRAAMRGFLVSFECGDGEVRPMSEWLRVGRAGLVVVAMSGAAGSVDAELVRRVEQREAAAHRLGLDVDPTTWSALVGVAAGYLIPEATLDAAEAPG